MELITHLFSINPGRKNYIRGQIHPFKAYYSMFRHSSFWSFHPERLFFNMAANMRGATCASTKTLEVPTLVYSLPLIYYVSFVRKFVPINARTQLSVIRRNKRTYTLKTFQGRQDNNQNYVSGSMTARNPIHHIKTLSPLGALRNRYHRPNILRRNERFLPDSFIFFCRVILYPLLIAQLIEMQGPGVQAVIGQQIIAW